jgi:glucosamine--fructose-6-phosphate aminotransferase (isomerizing)
MCGIIGYTGKRNCTDFLIEGLKNLEYRGYDSAGIAVIENNGRITIKKKQGRVSKLEKETGNIAGTCGIGHTRWATHGIPSDINAHPHFSGKFAVVHNGIIENFLELKVMLVNKGVKFSSETDTEVIAHLLNLNYNGNLKGTINKTLSQLVGSYAIAIICTDYPDLISVAKKDNPLIIGTNKDEVIISSDISAISNISENFYVLKDFERAIICPDKIEFFGENEETIGRLSEKIDVGTYLAEKGNFDSFMLKEIHEIPEALYKTFTSFKEIKITEDLKQKFKNLNNLTIIACGTAYNSGLVGKYIIERFCRIKVDTEIASEFRYKNPIIDKDDLVIAISQSGETADTIAAVKLAKERGAFVIAVTNTQHSQLTRIADFSILLKAGVEIAVAATKSYNCQLAAMYFLCNQILKAKNMPQIKININQIQQKAEQTVKMSYKLIELAGKYKNSHSVFYIGRGLDYSVAVEASLKLKEISYIHSEGYAAGELKHGTLALIYENSLVIVLITDKELSVKTKNALHEVIARGAPVLLFSQYEELKEKKCRFFKLPGLDDILMPLIEIIPLQLFAYFVTRSKGLDADKPRNLAKSVTVE